MLASISASAQQAEQPPTDVVTFYGATTSNYDSNLFHLPHASDAKEQVGGGDGTDFYQALAIGTHLDKFYGLQEFYGDASYAHSWYQTYSFLDASQTNYDLGWNWHLTPRIAGTLTGTRKQTPSDYDYYSDYSQRNSSTQQNYQFRVNAHPFGGWYVIAGTGLGLSSNTVSTGDTPKSQLHYFDGGFAYETPAGSHAQLVGRHSQGNYSNSNTSQFANARDFKEDSGELQLATPPDRILIFRLTAGYLSRKHDELSQRDYEGWTGDGRIIWQPREKLGVSLVGRRTLSAFQDSFFYYYKRNDLSLEPRWDVGEKLYFTGSVGVTQTRFAGQANPDVDEHRTDKVFAWSISGNWTPYTFLLLTGGVGSRNRSSDFDVQDLDYNGTTANLGLTLTF